MLYQLILVRYTTTFNPIAYALSCGSLSTESLYASLVLIQKYTCMEIILPFGILYCTHYNDRSNMKYFEEIKIQYKFKFRACRRCGPVPTSKP
jgi:hypothetical protein